MVNGMIRTTTRRTALLSRPATSAARSTLFRLKLPSKLKPLWSDPQRTASTRESRPARIAGDVLNYAPKMLFIANNSVVTLLLPQGPRSLNCAIDAPRAVLLPAAQNVLERVWPG